MKKQQIQDKEPTRDLAILEERNQAAEDKPMEETNEALKSEDKSNNYFVDDLRLNSASYKNMSSFISNKKR